MRFTILPFQFQKKYFYISPLTGNLIVCNNPINNTKINIQLKNALSFIENPYSVFPLDYEDCIIKNKVKLSKLNNYNNKLMWLGNKNFLLSCFYSMLQVPFFENTIEAFDYISELDIHKEKKGKICLQRALLASKTSKSFKQKGTLFVGAQLPTWCMHCWIIENGVQPDRQDREWIMYQPLLAINF